MGLSLRGRVSTFYVSVVLTDTCPITISEIMVTWHGCFSAGTGFYFLYVSVAFPTVRPLSSPLYFLSDGQDQHGKALLYIYICICIILKCAQERKKKKRKNDIY